MTQEGVSARHTAGRKAAIARPEEARDGRAEVGHWKRHWPATQVHREAFLAAFSLLHQNGDYSASINGSGASQDSWRFWGEIWGFTPDTTPEYI